METAKTERPVESTRQGVESDLRDGGTMSHDAIARRAYDLYLARGSADGNALGDWLQAEAEMRGAWQKA